MAQLLSDPTILQAAGTPPKTIAEFVGRLATGTSGVSIAVMHSPAGWSEPGQRPEFDEYTVVIEGEVLVETEDTSFSVAAGQASVSPRGTVGSLLHPDGGRGALRGGLCPGLRPRHGPPRRPSVRHPVKPPSELDGADRLGAVPGCALGPHECEEAPEPARLDDLVHGSAV